jgi:hypothetical protein
MDPLRSKEGPVSFSIKAKEVEAPGAAELRSVLPYDDSSDEEGNKVQNGVFDIRELSVDRFHCHYSKLFVPYRTASAPSNRSTTPEASLSR